MYAVIATARSCPHFKDLLIFRTWQTRPEKGNGGGSRSGTMAMDHGSCVPSPGHLEYWHSEEEVAAPKRTSLPLHIEGTSVCRRFSRWPVGLMDKASASGAGDSRFESWAGHFFLFRHKVHGCPRSMQVHLSACSTNLWLGLGSPSMRMFVWSGQSCLPVHD